MLWMFAAAAAVAHPLPPTAAPPLAASPNAPVAGPVSVHGAANPVPARRLSFDEAIERGTERYLDARLSSSDIERAAATLQSVQAQTMPTLSLGGSYTRLDHDREFAGRVSIYRDELAGNLTLNVPLVAPVQWARRRQSRMGLEVARLQDAAVRRQVAALVGRGYFAVLTCMRLTQVSQHAQQTAAAHFDFAHARYVGGVGNHLDELRADQELAASEAQLHAALTARVRASEALGVLVGEVEPFEVDPEPQLLDLPRPLSPSSLAEAEVMPEKQQRADIRAAYGRLTLARQVERDNWVDFLPSLALQAMPFLQHPALSTVPTSGWQAMLTLNWPLYDGGGRYGAHAERRVLVHQARLRLDFSVLQARAEVRTALVALEHARDALEVSQRASARAQDAIELSSQAYSAGSTTTLEVIDAERRGRDAATAAIMAEDTVRQARLDLLLALGKFP